MARRAIAAGKPARRNGTRLRLQREAGWKANLVFSEYFHRGNGPGSAPHIRRNGEA
jgi:hypothetical protein